MIAQRTEEWLEIRAGKFTGSEIHKLMGVKGIGKTGETYIYERVAEQLGAHLPRFENIAMQHGTATEPFAKAYYERSEKVNIVDQSFIVSRWCDQAGCSPDGILEAGNKGLEVKCPYNPVVHLQNFMIGSVAEFKAERTEYYWQIQMCMAVCEIDLWDFVSYSDEFQDDLRMMILEIPANMQDIELLKSRIFEAVKMKNEIIKKILIP
jgi:putative phage-type endonuclease